MIRTIITGSTGMVGEGVLHVCLGHPEVESVLVINRRPSGVKHAKLKEIIVKDFFDIDSAAGHLKDYNACYFCSGISSVGMKEEDYSLITYDLTIHFADTLLKLNPGMTFCYVSGTGTDSSEKGRIMWARVKGRTENDLMKMPFRSSYMFRPGFIQPIKGLKNTYSAYRILSPVIPALIKLLPGYTVTLRNIGLAMINVTLKQPEKRILDNIDIRELAK